MANTVLACYLQRVVRRFTRRKRWELEVLEVLQKAGYAARKLNVEMRRGTIEGKAEFDWLVEKIERIQHLRGGPENYDAQPNAKLSDATKEVPNG